MYIMQQHSSLPTRSNSIDPPYCKRIKLRMKLNPTNNFDDPKILFKKFVFEKLVQEKKLTLVLDLDHTLLHSVNINRLEPEDRDLVLKGTYDPTLSGLFRIKLNEKEDFVTKLRPQLRYFLEEVNKMFQLHVFTKGSRDYAMELLKLIDPDNDYFGCKSSSSSRVLTRENCVGGKKSLDLVMGKDRGILIVDDKKKVWRHVDRENVLEIPKYKFFELGSGDQKLSGHVEGTESDESRTDRWLAKFLSVLQMIHATFFDPQEEGDVLERDARALKKNVLLKCYYSGQLKLIES